MSEKDKGKDLAGMIPLDKSKREDDYDPFNIDHIYPPDKLHPGELDILMSLVTSERYKQEKYKRNLEEIKNSGSVHPFVDEKHLDITITMCRTEIDRYNDMNRKLDILLVEASRLVKY